MNVPTNLPSGAGGVIYNVTVKVDAAIAEDWLIWMLNDHIPAIMNTGCFNTFNVVRLMDMDESEGPTYAVQYHAPTIGDYQQYMAHFAAGFHQQAAQKWGQQLVFFATAMQVIH